jgi:hypothetical protein
MRLLLTFVVVELVYKAAVRQHVRRAIGYTPLEEIPDAGARGLARYPVAHGV